MKLVDWKNKEWRDKNFTMKSRSPSLLGFRLLTTADTFGATQSAVPAKGSAFQIGHALGNLIRSATTIHHVGIDLSSKTDRTVVATAVVRKSRKGYYVLSLKEAK